MKGLLSDKNEKRCSSFHYFETLNNACVDEESDFTRLRLSAAQLGYLKEYSDDLYLRGRCHPNVTVCFVQQSERLKVEFYVEMCARAHFDLDVYVDGVYAEHLVHPIKTLPFTYCVTLRYPHSKIELFVSNLCPWEIKSITGEWRAIGSSSCFKKGKKRILILGDSISQGMETDAPSLTYSNLLYRKEGYAVWNQSVGGIQFDPKFLELVPNCDVYKLIIMLGTNDILKELEIQNIKANIDAYFHLLLQKFERKKILVISPIHLLTTDHNTIGREGVVRKKILENTRLHGITLIDGRTFFPRSTNFYYDDGIHPNETGNFLMYDCMKDFL